MTKCPAHTLSRKNLKDRGFLIDTTEWYNAYTKRKKDMYHFIDIIGLNRDIQETLAVQATTKGHLSTRIKKAEGLVGYHEWLACGNPVEFHGWYKPKYIWVPKIIRVEISSLLS